MFSIYRVFLLLKFVGVLMYAGGFAAAFLATSLRERKRAVHAVASPGLVLVWTAGYILTTELQVPLTELWILGGLVLSLLSLMGLIFSVSRDKRTVPAFCAAALPLLLVLACMV